MAVNPVFDAYSRMNELVGDARLMPAWSPDGATLAFVSGPAEQRQVWRVDLKTGKKTPLCDVDSLRKAIKDATGITPPGQGVPFAHFGFAAPHIIAFAVGEHSNPSSFIGEAHEPRYLF